MAQPLDLHIRFVTLGTLALALSSCGLKGTSTPSSAAPAASADTTQASAASPGTVAPEQLAAQTKVSQTVATPAQTQTNSQSRALQLTSSTQPAGWDPGLTVPAIATYDQAYQNCPWEPNGQCSPTLPPGGGFYTMGLDIGGNFSACLPNSGNTGGTAPVTLNGVLTQQPCPFRWGWLGGPPSTTPLEADIDVDTTGWAKAPGGTPNVYEGFQDATPYQKLDGTTVYLGDNAKYMPTIGSATLDVNLLGSLQVGGVESVRYLAGLTWYNTSLGKSFVVELNLASINPVPLWQSSASWVGGLNTNPGCIESIDKVQCVYSSGAHWGIPSPLNANGLIPIHIDWGTIVRGLQTAGLLDTHALDYEPTISSMYVGTEILGHMHSNLKVTGFTMGSSASGVATAVIPPGFRFVNTQGYAVNSAQHYCTIGSWPQWLAMGGPANAPTPYAAMPPSMTSDGQCTLSNVFFFSGTTGYYANKTGHYCAYPSWQAWLAAGGPTTGYQTLPSIPNSMTYDGICK